jgi:TetR/AcrR family transcriptional regulator
MKIVPVQQSGKSKRDAVATKATIVAAALEEFARLGLAGARIDEIARTARVNKALLYYYFESKEHLFLGVVEQMFLAMTSALRNALSTAKEPREKLLAFLDANFKVLAAEPAYARLLEQEMDMVRVFFLNSFKADEESRFSRQIIPLLTEFRAVLEEGVKTGVFRIIDIDAVLPLLLMLVRTAVRGIPMAGKFISASKKVSAKRRRAAAIDFITCALFTVESKQQNGRRPGSSQ